MEYKLIAKDPEKSKLSTSDEIADDPIAFNREVPAEGIVQLHL